MEHPGAAWSLACPVCTLYLREGMSMQSHLNTHPKDQVIEALIRLYTTERSDSPVAESGRSQAIQRGLSPVPILSPLQVVSEEHIFLGRQQVTNLIHTPVITYPVYQPPQQCISPVGEFVGHENGCSIETAIDPLLPVSDAPSITLINLSSGQNTFEDMGVKNMQEVVPPSPPPLEFKPDVAKSKYEEEPIGSPQSQCSNYSVASARSYMSQQGENTVRGISNEEFIGPDCEYQNEDACQGEDALEMENDVADYELNAHEFVSEEMEEYVDDPERSNSGLNINIQANESMPAHGELSGQESLGNSMSSIWIEEPNPVMLMPEWMGKKEDNKEYNCLYCDEKFICPKERRVHIATLHCSQETKDKEREKPFLCSKCGLSLSSQQELKKHSAIEHRRVIRKCTVCKETFPSQEEYADHISKVHPLECRTCGKTFFTRASLYVHTKTHLDIKPHACTVCSKTFITPQKLREHMNGHTGFAPLQCNLCDKKFKRYSNLKQHKDSAHYNVKKKTKEFFCTCGESFTSKKKLAWHQETHSEKPKQCMFCSERYIHSASLTRHIRRAHDNQYLPSSSPSDSQLKKKNVVCPICNLVFMDTSLRAHMKLHTAAKQHGCVVCGKKFLTKWNLNLHKLTHASRLSKPYKCSLCKGAFVRETDLQAHIRAHVGSKPYTCNHCGMQFNRKNNWQRHEREHFTNKKYTCKECGKMFHRSYYLIEHARVHTGFKPYSCHICNKTSTTKSNHNKHVRTHHAREVINTEG